MKKEHENLNFNNLNIIQKQNFWHFEINHKVTQKTDQEFLAIDLNNLTYPFPFALLFLQIKFNNNPE